MKTNALPSRSAGFSLVELMIALVVSLLLLAGVLQILLSNRNSTAFQRDMARLQEDARLSSFVIENVVAHAGYRVQLDDDHLFKASDRSSNGVAFANGAYIAGADGPGQSGDNASDVLRVRFQVGEDHKGCSGPEIGVTEAPESTLKLADLEFHVDDTTLRCLDHSAGGDQEPQPIVEHVVRFNVAYGIDDTGDGSVNTYVNTLASNKTDRLISVHIQLLLRSDARIADQPIAHVYEFADGTSFEKTDRHAYEYIDQVIALRNGTP